MMRRIGAAAFGALVAVTSSAVLAAPAHAGEPAPGPTPTQAAAEIVVHLDVANGYTLNTVTSKYPVALDKSLLGSRGIYLLRSTSPKYAGKAGAQQLAGLVAHTTGVLYAEPNLVTSVDYTRFHAWPNGASQGVGTNSSSWTDQPAVQQLRLDDAHAISTGAGVTVAVLDTGADPHHPALAGRLVTGWNYVEDSSNINDVADPAPDDTGTPNQARGHGTFVAGEIALVAPQAKILVERVLNSDGYGNVFTIAQAIIDAVHAGARVINMSFGTTDKIPSKVLQDAINTARRAGAVIVAAAGNDANNHPHFPAASKPVISVSALNPSQSSLASFADFGPWVQVAAPGSSIVGPVPGGGYALWSGTSMAAPFVAGECALLFAKAPTAKSDGVIAAVQHSARKVPGAQLAFGSIDILRGLGQKLPG